MSRVELFEKIRRDHRQGASIRALERKYHVHRRTVRQALESAVPPGRRTPERESPKLGPYKDTIRTWLEAEVFGASLVGLNHHAADDIGRHQIRGKLNSAEAEV
jgi:transposase